MQAAEQFPETIFIDCSFIRSTSDLSEKIRTELFLKGLLKNSDHFFKHDIIEILQHKNILLILDNFINYDEFIDAISVFLKISKIIITTSIRREQEPAADLFFFIKLSYLKKAIYKH